MADLFQGSALPSVTETTQTQTVAPEFYTNYLQDIANLGQNAIQQGGVAGLSPLQQQALNMAPTTAFAGSETLGRAAQTGEQAKGAFSTAGNVLGGATGAYEGALGTLGDATGMLYGSGTTIAPKMINQYMNPYTKNVVDEMARLSQENVKRSVMPALRAAGVGTGGFGSSRMANATGQTLADIQAGLTGQQYQALGAGYDAAMKAAQADLERQLQAGQGLTQAGQAYGQIGQGIGQQASQYADIGQGLNQLMSGLAQTGTQQGNLAQNALKSLADLGLIEQNTAQKLLDYPMMQAGEFAKLLQPYASNIPMGTVKQTTGPGQQGQFTNSPLSQISGLMMALGSLYQGMGNTGGTQPAPQTTPPAGSKYTDESGGINWGSVIGDIAAGVLNPENIQSFLGFADGGSVKGGLQSMLESRDNIQPMNYNVPETSSIQNSNVPMIGMNPPPMTPAPLNYSANQPDYTEVG